jgi:hypothetical protein
MSEMLVQLQRNGVEIWKGAESHEWNICVVLDPHGSTTQQNNSAVHQFHNTFICASI